MAFPLLSAGRIGKKYEDLTLPTWRRVCNTSDVRLEGFSLSVFLLPNHTQTTSAGDSTSLWDSGLCPVWFQGLAFPPRLTALTFVHSLLRQLGWLCGGKVCVGGKESHA